MKAADLEPALASRSFTTSAGDAWRREGPPAVTVRLTKGSRVDVDVDGLARVRVRTGDPAQVLVVIDRLCGANTGPPGTLPVPLDAWNRMLAQLGNIHDAGEQMAEARERAAVAETKVAFLRERLATRRRRDPGLFGGLFERR